MQTSSKPSISFKPLSASFGAEIVGLDPEHLTAEDAKALREGWAKYHVLVMRNTPMSEDTEIEFAKAFGALRPVKPNGPSVTTLARRQEIMVISNIRENGVAQGALPDGEMDWHYDGLHQPTPYFGAVLHAIEVPKAGGETKFTNMCAVYRSLPEKTRARIDGLTALNIYDYSATTFKGSVRDTDAARAVQPVVRVREDTGEKALFVCRLMTEQIVELPEAESAELLQELFTAIDDFPERFEHTWSPGDTVIWDNRCVTHARNDFDPSERRYLKRVTIIAS